MIELSKAVSTITVGLVSVSTGPTCEARAASCLWKLLRPFLIISAALLCATPIALSEESEQDSADRTETEEDTENAADGPKTMSGMSILGNEEAPKSLVIIPWKSSELGEDLSLSNTLDDRARPVDKEVFLRELSFYEIRAAE